MEAGAELVGLPAARVETGLRGEGATVCLVDTGVDSTLPDLRDASDGTRVRWLLDLDAPPRGVHPELEAEFGAAVYDADDLDALGPAAPGDWHGHGTALAAIAVGDDADVGQDEPGPRAGAAPSASLVVVRALRRGVPGFRDEDLELGARFCFAVAGVGSAPTDASRTVVLLGSGGHDGAHDGTSALEQALEAEVASGHAVVVAAGNDGGRHVHAAADVADASRADVPFFVPAPVGAPGARSVALAVFVAPGSDARVSLIAPDGTRTPEVAIGQEHCVDHSGGRLCVDARAPAVDGSRRVHALVLGGGDVATELAGGRYVLEVVGGGRFDAWLAGVDLGVALGRAEFLGELADGGSSVAIPATAAGVLAVGAATSRPPRSGHDLDATCLGCALPSSSRGPNRLGQPKPDLIAPGGYVLVPRSSQVRVGDAENFFAGLSPSRVTFVDVDGRVALTGSSFAAPWVAGALALAYSESPADVSRDADLLRATARPSDGWAYTPAAGAGLLDAGTFLLARARVQGAASVGLSSFARTDSDGLWVVRLLDDQGWPGRGSVSLTTADGESTSVEVHAGWAALTPPSGQTSELSLDGRRWASVGGSSGCSVGFGVARAPVSFRASGLWALLGLALLGSALRRRRSAGRCGCSRPCSPRRAAAPRG